MMTDAERKRLSELVKIDTDSTVTEREPPEVKIEALIHLRKLMAHNAGNGDHPGEYKP